MSSTVAALHAPRAIASACTGACQRPVGCLVLPGRRWCLQNIPSPEQVPAGAGSFPGTAATPRTEPGALRANDRGNTWCWGAQRAALSRAAWGFLSQFFKSTKVLMATPRLGFHTPSTRRINHYTGRSAPTRRRAPAVRDTTARSARPTDGYLHLRACQRRLHLHRRLLPPGGQLHPAISSVPPAACGYYMNGGVCFLSSLQSAPLGSSQLSGSQVLAHLEERGSGSLHRTRAKANPTFR